MKHSVSFHYKRTHECVGTRSRCADARDVPTPKKVWICCYHMTTPLLVGNIKYSNVYTNNE